MFHQCWYIPPQSWAQLNSFLCLLSYWICLRPQCQVHVVPSQRTNCKQGSLSWSGNYSHLNTVYLLTMFKEKRIWAFLDLGYWATVGIKFLSCSEKPSSKWNRFISNDCEMKRVLSWTIFQIKVRKKRIKRENLKKMPTNIEAGANCHIRSTNVQK